MSNWPIAAGTGRTTQTFNDQVTITAGAAANEDGAWAEVLSAAANPGGSAILLGVTPGNSQNTNRRVAVTLGMGPAGEETPILEHVGFITGSFRASAFTHLLPLRIPPGVRLAMRMRQPDTQTERILFVACEVVRATPLAPMGFARCVHLGFDAANCRGIGVQELFNPGGPITELSAALPFRVRAILPVLWGRDTGSAYGAIRTMFYVGPAGAEAIATQTVFHSVSQHVVDAGVVHASTVIPCDLPAGARFSVRSRGLNSSFNWWTSVLCFG